MRYLVERLLSSERSKRHRHYALVTIVCAEPVIDIEDVVIVFVIVSVVVRRLARFCQHSPWVVCGFISELWVANVVCIHKVGC